MPDRVNADEHSFHNPKHRNLTTDSTANLPAQLIRGRSAVLTRAFLSSGLRAFLACFLVFAPIFAGLSLFFHLFAIKNSTEQWTIAASGLFLLCLCVALLQAFTERRNATKKWYLHWDKMLKLPQTVVTLVEVLQEGHDSPWSSYFLSRELESLALPHRLALRKYFPVFYSRTLMISPLTLCIVFGASQYALPSGVWRDPEVIIQQERVQAFEQKAERWVKALQAHVKQQQAPEALVKILDDLRVKQDRKEEVSDLIEQALSKADDWRSLERDRATKRAKIAKKLAAYPQTEALSKWLRSGKLLTEDNAKLGQGKKFRREHYKLLQQAAKDLRKAGLLSAAQYLKDISEGRENARAPVLAPLGMNFHEAQRTHEFIRQQQSDQASFMESALATGGNDKVFDEKGAEVKFEEFELVNGLDSLELFNGIPLASGERLDAGALALPQTVGDPQWQDLLARPEVEDHWLGVAQKYLSLIQQKKDAATAPAPNANSQNIESQNGKLKASDN